MNATRSYDYARSTKSDVSDELINTYLLRPIAGVIVRLLYYTPVTPNQVTLAAILCGILSATMFTFASPLWTALAGLMLTAKDLLDSADGQLARAKEMYSRAGRFLDSIGDLFVNLLVFAAMTGALVARTSNSWMFLACAAGLLGLTLRVSYHVFYHTAFLHLHDSYRLNRLTEEMRPEDYAADRLTFGLQKIFLLLYGWQDRLMEKIDTWCRGSRVNSSVQLESWYGDIVGVRLSGFLGMGTELMLLTICSIFDRIELYLSLNLFGMNGIWCLSVFYRRFVLGPRTGVR